MGEHVRIAGCAGCIGFAPIGDLLRATNLRYPFERCYHNAGILAF
jgi:hypothetical protein